MPRIVWTADMLERAKRMRFVDGWTYAAIDEALGVKTGNSYHKLAMLDPRKRERQRQAERNWRINREKPQPCNHIAARVHVDPRAAQEREAALAVQRDLTATLMGDPPVSRSALARKLEQQGGNHAV